MASQLPGDRSPIDLESVPDDARIFFRVPPWGVYRSLAMAVGGFARFCREACKAGTFFQHPKTYRRYFCPRCVVELHLPCLLNRRFWLGWVTENAGYVSHWPLVFRTCEMVARLLAGHDRTTSLSRSIPVRSSARTAAIGLRSGTSIPTPWLSPVSGPVCKACPRTRWDHPGNSHPRRDDGVRRVIRISRDWPRNPQALISRGTRSPIFEGRFPPLQR